jgi:hypothetical protein
MAGVMIGETLDIVFAPLTVHVAKYVVVLVGVTAIVTLVAPVDHTNVPLQLTDVSVKVAPAQALSGPETSKTLCENVVNGINNERRRSFFMKVRVMILCLDSINKSMCGFRLRLRSGSNSRQIQYYSPPPSPTNRQFHPAFHHYRRFEAVLDVVGVYEVLAVNAAEIWRIQFIFKYF